MDAATRDDVKTFISRVAAIGFGEALLLARQDTLAVFGCVAAPKTLLDQTPTVLVMRAAQLAEPSDLNRVVEIRALLDRFARVEGRGSTHATLPVPPMDITAAWAGVQPPLDGWETQGHVDAASLREVARTGAEQVQQQLPNSPGAAIVDGVRQRVWSQEIMPGVPAYAAFALETLGFFSDEASVPMTVSGPWLRLSGTHGHVLVRNVG